jgi:hypothetical protein
MGGTWIAHVRYVQEGTQMVGFRMVCVALSSVVVLSCGSAPVKVVAGDYCYGCRRSIRNVRLASEMISGERSRFVSKFRGPGCMAKYLVAHPDEKATIYVTNYKSGKMMRPAGAFFVAEVVDRNTGETEYRSYNDETEARSAAAELQTTLLSWDEVLDKAR